MQLPSVPVPTRLGAGTCFKVIEDGEEFAGDRVLRRFELLQHNADKRLEGAQLVVWLEYFYQAWALP